MRYRPAFLLTRMETMAGPDGRFREEAKMMKEKEESQQAEN